MKRMTLEYQMAQRMGSMKAYGTKKADRKGINNKIASRSTLENYVHEVKKAGKFFFKTYGPLNLDDITTDHIQAYLDALCLEGKSAWSQNLACAALCKLYQLPMSTFRRDMRCYTDVHKGRSEAFPTKLNSVETLASHIGVRRAELMDMKVCHIVERPEGLCAYVEQGKGGKSHYQLILPAHEAALRELIKNKAAEEYLVDRACTKGKENIHGFRRELAREAYAYYTKRLEQEGDAYRKELKQTCLDRMRECNIDSASNGDWKRIDTLYATRPNTGEPSQAFNRLATLATSIFHLSHWRCSVAIQHYLV